MPDKQERAKDGLLLVGDPAQDTYILLSPANGGKGDKWTNYPIWNKWTQPGGVHMLYDYLKIFADDQSWEQEYSSPHIESLSHISYLDKDHKLSNTRDSTSKPLYRISNFDGYQGTPVKQASIEPKSTLKKELVNQANRKILAISDAGNGIRSEGHIWENYLGSKNTPELVFLKRHLPLLSKGEQLPKDKLWHAFANCSDTMKVLLVSADDLRAEGIRLSRGLSWEAAAHDLVESLNNNESTLQKLALQTDILIILFDVEAAFVIEKTDTSGLYKTKLIFDPLLAEGDVEEKYPGSIYGKMNYFTACILASLVQRPQLSEMNISELIKQTMPGLQSYVRQPMHCEDTNPEKLVVKFGKAVGNKKKSEKENEKENENESESESENKPAIYKTIIIDSSQSAIAPSFVSGIDDSAIDVMKRAEDIVKNGLPELGSVPSATFGDFTTVDKREIESYRAINRLIKNYQKNTNISKPISIAVFGPPGAGKSFGVTQLVDKHKTPIKTFNLSEASVDDLPGFFHEIRTEALEGHTPLCFFDEFDTDQCSLVSSFLAPMQDGKFREGARVHPTGRAIFVFAGGTSSSFNEFYIKAKADEANESGMGGKKLMDFVSRLSGYIDVKGPNTPTPLADKKAGTQTKNETKNETETDDYKPLRRAILLRAMIKKELDSIISTDTEEVSIDPGVLKAFLNIEKYKHGSRSIEKILKMCAQGQQTDRLSVSDLPHEDQLELHVDAARFIEIASEMTTSDDT